MEKLMLTFTAGLLFAIGIVLFLAMRELPTTPPSSEELMDVYYRGAEELGPDEMKVVALGTGMQSARPKQAAACCLVELGNGNKCIFDIGLGSSKIISAQLNPYDYLDKLFIGHLHADHIGDLDGLWIGG